MEELISKAMEVANETSIDQLKSRLESYSMRSNVEWKDGDEAGSLRWALRKHINRDIKLASFDLKNFIIHFS